MLKSSIYFNKVLYTYFLQKTLMKYLSTIFSNKICRLKIIKACEIELLIESKNIYSVLYFLKNNTLTQCKVIVDIVLSDNPGKIKRFFISYLLQSIYNYRIKITSKFCDLA
jgi:hypothetical protein